MNLLTGGLLVRVQPEETLTSTSSPFVVLGLFPAVAPRLASLIASGTESSPRSQLLNQYRAGRRGSQWCGDGAVMEDEAEPVPRRHEGPDDSCRRAARDVKARPFDRRRGRGQSGVLKSQPEGGPELIITAATGATLGTR